MAFDPKTHEIHPETGFMVHKETGHHVGLVAAPATPVSRETEWPKWVTPHGSHVIRRRVDGSPDHVSTPHFAHFHIDRTSGKVSVMVADEAEEERALAAAAPEPHHEATEHHGFIEPHEDHEA